MQIICGYILGEIFRFMSLRKVILFLSQFHEGSCHAHKTKKVFIKETRRIKNILVLARSRREDFIRSNISEFMNIENTCIFLQFGSVNAEINIYTL